MEQHSYQQAWQDYQAAVSALYEAPGGAAERGARGVATGADADGRVQAVIDRSAVLTEATARGLESADREQRELAELQLIAAAAYDLAVANDLAYLAEDGPTDRAERSAGLAIFSDDTLLTILTTPQEAGMRALMEAELAASRSPLPRSLPAAKEALREAIEGALQDISADAARTGQTALGGLVTMQLSTVKEAASVVLRELMARLSDGVSVLLRKAAQLVAQAIDKLLRVLGKEAQDEWRQKVAGWIEDLQSGGLFSTLLGKLYETERIERELVALVDAVPDTVDPALLHEAQRRVDELALRFGKQRKTVEWVLRALGVAQNWMLGVQPWGPLAYVSAHSAVIGYVVYTGGDYVDWYRGGGRLDAVDGVRTAVLRELASTEAPPALEEEERFTRSYEPDDLETGARYDTDAEPSDVAPPEWD
jgi:hypothetical protein